MKSENFRTRMSYHHVSGIDGMEDNPFINEDTRKCYFDYERTVLLRLWLSKKSTKRTFVSQQVNLGLVLE